MRRSSCRTICCIRGDRAPTSYPSSSVAPERITRRSVVCEVPELFARSEFGGKVELRRLAIAATLIERHELARVRRVEVQGAQGRCVLVRAERLPGALRTLSAVFGSL